MLGLSEMYALVNVGVVLVSMGTILTSACSIKKMVANTQESVLLVHEAVKDMAKLLLASPSVYSDVPLPETRWEQEPTF